MKKKNKGFTLLELVIVIAVIAVLAAILIPTFAGVIKRSKLSTDIMACKNLNTTSASIEISDNKAPQTMTEVIASMVENGYKVDNLKTANTDNVFVYDSVNNRFFVYDFVSNKITYKDEGTTVNLTDAQTKVTYWIVSDTYAQTNENLQGFSIYLRDGYTGTTTLDINTGLDVGTNTNIEAINYTSTSSQTVTICTNGGTLTINGKNDNVNHFGYAESVNIIDVATASYHENGEVKFMEVSAGHIVIEESATVSAFHFTATGEGENAKFENADGKKISLDLSNVEEEKMPTFTRDAVVIEQNGTYVAQVKTESTEYIWLFGQGIKEQMVVTNTNETIAENGVLKQNVETGAEDGSVAEQIANPAKRNENGELVDNDNNVVTVENAIVEELPSKEDVQIGATLFDGGTGTEKDPFVIVDYDTMQHVDTISSTSDEYYYFKVKDGIDFIDCNENGRSWSMVYISGHFDGNNTTFINLDKPLFYYNNFLEETLIKNFTISLCNIVSGYSSAVFYYAHNVRLLNVNLDSTCYIEGSTNAASYIAFGYSADFMKIENCVSSAMIVCCSNYGAGFVGQGLGTAYNKTTSIYIIDSVFNGTIANTNSKKVYYYAHGANDGKVKVYIENSEGFNADEGLWSAASGNNSSLDYRYTNANACTLLSKKTGTAPSRYSSFEATKVTGAVRARIEFHISCSANDGTGGYDVIYVSKDIDLTTVQQGATFNSDDVIYFGVTVNNTEAGAGLSADGRTYNVINDYYKACDGLSAKMIQYDVRGNIVGITTYALSK